MIYLSRPKRIALFLLVAALAAAGTAACASAPPTPTAAPTATPTPVPTPTPTLVKTVRIDPRKDPAGFLAALPPAEVECAVKVAGGREQLASIVSGKVAPGSDQVAAIRKCMSKGTVLAVLAGQIERASGPLSERTLSCIAGRSDNINFETLVSTEPAPESVIGLMQALFCLDKAERAEFEKNGQGFALVQGGIDSVECFVNAAGPANLVSVVEFLQRGKGQLPPALIGAVLKCGLPPVSLPAAQATPVPSASPVPAAVGTTAPAPSPVPAIGLPPIGLTPQQIACVAARAGPDAVATLQSGAVDLTKLLPFLGVFAECNIDVNRLLATPAPPR